MHVLVLATIAISTGAAGQVAPASTQPQPQPLPIATPVVSTAPQAVILTTPTESVLRSGTEVALVTAEPLTTAGKMLRSGQRVQLQVAAPVLLNGMVVIPAGSPAVGEITDVRNKGMWGKSGRINARVLNVRVGDRTIRLSGTFDDKGVSGTAAVVGSVLLLPVAGFFMTGTSANIPAGSAVKGFLDEDLKIASGSVTP